MTFSKHFTPAQATKTLPLVRVIVMDILRTAQELRKMAATGNIDGTSSRALSALEGKLSGYFAELHELGCLYKDWSFSVGLVDFPAIIEGEEVLLCWKSDETELQFYHSLDAGFAGRKIIPPELWKVDQ